MPQGIEKTNYTSSEYLSSMAQVLISSVEISESEGFLTHFRRRPLDQELETARQHRKQILSLLEINQSKHDSEVEWTVLGERVLESVSWFQDTTSGARLLASMYRSDIGDSTMSIPPKIPYDDQKISVMRLGIADSTGPTNAEHTTCTITTVRNFWSVFQDTLFFKEECERQLEIKEAHRLTFGWLFGHTEDGKVSDLHHWLTDPSSVFWISGKPGSGKSTLLKYIQHHPQAMKALQVWSNGKQLLFPSFYFWYAGTHLQNSYEGLLRSLLRQILEARPELTQLIFPAEFKNLIIRSQNGIRDTQGLTLSLKALQHAMKLCAKNMPDDMAICLLVDGVDEFIAGSETDHLEFSNFLLELTACNSIKLLVSSRPIPACHQAFAKYPHLQLQNRSSPDIKAYVTSELLQDPLLVDKDKLEPGLIAELSDALIRKSQGVFLWIEIVVNNLRKCLGQHDSRTQMIAEIYALPTKLETLYSHLFGKVSGRDRREASTLLCLFHRARQIQPNISTMQFYLAGIHAGIWPSNATTRFGLQHLDLCTKEVDGKLRSRCWGLIEVSDVDAKHELNLPKIEYFHLTALDYLNEPTNWDRVEECSKLCAMELDAALQASSAQMLWFMEEDALLQVSLSTDLELPLKELVDASLQYDISSMEILDPEANYATILGQEPYDPEQRIARWEVELEWLKMTSAAAKWHIMEQVTGIVKSKVLGSIFHAVRPLTNARAARAGRFAYGCYRYQKQDGFLDATRRQIYSNLPDGSSTQTFYDSLADCEDVLSTYDHQTLAHAEYMSTCRSIIKAGNHSLPAIVNRICLPPLLFDNAIHLVIFAVLGLPNCLKQSQKSLSQLGAEQLSWILLQVLTIFDAPDLTEELARYYHQIVGALLYAGADPNCLLSGQYTNSLPPEVKILSPLQFWHTRSSKFRQLSSNMHSVQQQIQDAMQEQAHQYGYNAA